MEYVRLSFSATAPAFPDKAKASQSHPGSSSFLTTLRARVHLSPTSPQHFLIAGRQFVASKSSGAPVSSSDPSTAAKPKLARAVTCGLNGAKMTRKFDRG